MFPVLNLSVFFPSPYLDMLKSTIFYNIPQFTFLIIFPLTFPRPHSVKLPLLALNSWSTDKVSDWSSYHAQQGARFRRRLAELKHWIIETVYGEITSLAFMFQFSVVKCRRCWACEGRHCGMMAGKKAERGHGLWWLEGTWITGFGVGLTRIEMETELEVLRESLHPSFVKWEQ